MLLKVTQKNIHSGNKSSRECPVALALKDLGFDRVRVGVYSISVYDQETGETIIDTPDDIHQFIIDFDSGRLVHPCEFYLPLKYGLAGMGIE